MSEQLSPPKRPSLQMLRLGLEELPSLDEAVAGLPSRYYLRTYLPGDEAAWAEIMNTGEMGAWDVARTRAELTERPSPQFDPDGLFFVVDRTENRPIGSACAWLLDPRETEVGVVHMVCVLPEHRGHRLSYVVCLAVLHRLRERGYRRVRLSTHEWRLGAIKVYLELGFQPIYRDPLHPSQWQDVLRGLRWDRPVEPVVEDDAAKG